jgi:hypothetical protein
LGFIAHLGKMRRFLQCVRSLAFPFSLYIPLSWVVEWESIQLFSSPFTDTLGGNLTWRLESSGSSVFPFQNLVLLVFSFSPFVYPVSRTGDRLAAKLLLSVVSDFLSFSRFSFLSFVPFSILHKRSSSLLVVGSVRSPWQPSLPPLDPSGHFPLSSPPSS